MTKYWIVVNNAHEGPFTADQLAEMKLPGDTYAWYPGLPKWTKMKDMPELASLVSFDAEVKAEVEVEEETPDVAARHFEAPFSPAPPAPPSPAPRVTPPAPPSRPVTAQPVYNAPAPANNTVEKCPPSYLAWSIVTTILFFLPLGIVAIIYSSKVAGLWNAGEKERARRASEMAAWFSNISFTVGLIWMPFSMVMAMMF